MKNSLTEVIGSSTTPLVMRRWSVNNIVVKRLCLGVGCSVLFVNEMEKDKLKLNIEIDQLSSFADIDLDVIQIEKLRDFLNEFIEEQNG